MEQNNKERELIEELSFMYKKYEELCQSYKKLAESKGVVTTKQAHDMSHMSFIESNEEKK